MFFWVLILAFNAAADTEIMMKIPDNSSVLGQPIPNVVLVGEGGEQVNLHQAFDNNAPLILMPMFTRCASTCPLNVMHLRKIGGNFDNQDFNVALFSFDPRDRSEDLKKFKENMDLPKHWRLFTASADTTHQLLESLQFNYLTQEGQFVHPSTTVVITPDFRIAKYFRDLRYSSKELSVAAEQARTQKQTWRHVRPPILLSIFVGLITLTLILYRRHYKEMGPTDSR